MTSTTGLIRRARRRRLRVIGVLGVLIGLLTLGSGTASATIADRSGKVTQPYEFVNWDCGYELDVAGITTDQVLVRVDRTDPRIVFVTDNYQFHETWTAADGRSFVFEGNGLAKDVRAKWLGGSLYQFTFHNAGQTFLIRDSSGTLLSRDRGIFEFQYTLDLDNDTFNFVDFRLSGPHPSAGVDGCLTVAPLTGSNSASYLTPRPVGTTGFPQGFYEYLPPSYHATGTTSPLLVFTNGYGENGDGSPEQLPNMLNAGIPRFINIGGWPTDRPLVVLALQHHEEPGFDGSSCDGVPWGGSCNMQIQHDNDDLQPAFCTTPYEIHDFIAYAVSHYNVDPKRVYVTGLSCGGFGIWEYLAKYHASLQVAAAIPIAGDGRPAWSGHECGLGSTPLWAFHGALDDVVNPQGSIEPLTALQACPGVPADQAKLTVYPDRDHNSWDPAYSGSEGDDIYSWMLGFSQP
jgi:hypothetical protein